MSEPEERRGACIEGPYRWWLRRWWDDDLPTACWVMLNPSTADAFDDDATIRRVRTFTEREGCGGFVVVNLFAWRATNPNDLRGVADPIGRSNGLVIQRQIEGSAGPIIAAWGAGVDKVDRVRPNVEQYAERAGKSLRCFGTTKGGHPRHPLYLKADTPLVELETS